MLDAAGRTDAARRARPRVIVEPPRHAYGGTQTWKEWMFTAKICPPGYIREAVGEYPGDHRPGDRQWRHAAVLMCRYQQRWHAGPPADLRSYLQSMGQGGEQREDAARVWESIRRFRSEVSSRKQGLG
jgi:hypothetical protein